MDTPIRSKKRKLTKFLCREMLYDYTKSYLDEERTKAVREYLAEDEALQEDLYHLKSAMEYCRELGQLKVDENFLQYLARNKSNYTQFRELLAWRNLPEFAKWSLEALIISLSVAVFTIFVPWDRMVHWIPKDNSPQKEMQDPSLPIAEDSEVPINKEKSEGEIDSDQKQSLEASVPIKEGQVQAEGVNAVAAIDQVPEVVKTPGKVDYKDTDRIAKKSVVTSESNELSQIEKLKNEKSSTSKDDEYFTQNETISKKKAILVGSKQALKGELYRASISLRSVDKVTEELIQQIVSLGGKKAGKVKLGWKKSNSSYFHFYMSKENLEDLKGYIGKYGKLKVSKEPHWRVMPEGQIRMILEVEERDAQKQ